MRNPIFPKNRRLKRIVRALCRQRITLAPELYAQVEKEAQVRGISSETLVHLGLMEWLDKNHQLHTCEA